MLQPLAGWTLLAREDAETIGVREQQRNNILYAASRLKDTNFQVIQPTVMIFTNKIKQ